MGTYGKLMELNQPIQAEEKVTQEAKSKENVSPVVEAQPEKKVSPSRYRDTKQPRYHATMTPRYRDTTVELIRAAVKEFGKEAATQRWTVEEKRAVNEIKFTYQQQGIRTGETEIARIGINFLIEDYRQNGENSILHKVLKALNG